MLPPPVAPWFTPDTLDPMLHSYDTLSDVDPAPEPVVSATAKLPPTPPLILHVVPVSDTQPVACPPDSPTRTSALYLLPLVPAPHNHVIPAPRLSQHSTTTPFTPRRHMRTHGPHLPSCPYSSAPHASHNTLCTSNTSTQPLRLPPAARQHAPARPKVCPANRHAPAPSRPLVHARHA